MYDDRKKMTEKPRFPFFRWVIRTLTGRWARRIYVAVFLFTLLLTTTVRLRSYFMTRKIQAVLHGLAEVRVDQTTEEQLTKTVPYLIRSDHEWKNNGVTERWYHAQVSNESDWLWTAPFLWRIPWAGQIADWLGYKFIYFDAGVLIQDGKVSKVLYGLAKDWGQPRRASYIVSVESVHGFWRHRQRGFKVYSDDDESPQYRVNRWESPKVHGSDQAVSVVFTNDAPSELTKRAFQVDLSCFYSFRDCGGAREIAPGIWQDAERIKESAFQRLRAGTCPDSIVEGRMRYLPDITILLLEVTGSRLVKVNEDGAEVEDQITDYKMKEAIRGQNEWSWKNVRSQQMIRSPLDPERVIVNWFKPSKEIGSQMLFFGGPYFDSCRLIPATPSALDIVRKTPAPPRRPEDDVERYSGLQ
jgi:uncharacterized protein YlzI (FlbEa/FlbD family)